MSALRMFGVGIGALFLTGCLSQTAVMQDYRDGSSIVGLNVVDARPAEDKSTEFLSLWISSCDYGIRRLGDEKTVPSRLVLLRRDLEESLGDQLANKTITVSRYRIFFNKGSALLQSNPGNRSLAGPLIMSALTPGTNSCGLDKPEGGRYNSSEVSAAYSPIIIEIEVKLGAQDYSVRSVYSPKTELDGAFGERDEAAELFNAIRQADIKLADQLRQR